MVISFVRTIILYFCVVLALRIMGKRQLGELQPSELVVAIMISDLASVPMQSKSIPLLDGIIPIFSLVLVELIFSLAVLKSDKIRLLITGRPTIIIKNGEFIRERLKELRLSIDDIVEQARIAGYPDITQIETALIETNGQMSIIPKESVRPVSCGDLNKNPSQTRVPYTVIADGKLRKDNLSYAGVTKDWIEKKLSENNIKNIKDVFFMSVNDRKDIFVQLRNAK